MTETAPSRPTIVEPSIENIPPELCETPHWVTWKLVYREGQSKPWTKVPYRPSGDAAKTNDSTTWGTFDEACAAYESEDVDGIGYVFVDSDDILGVDLDNCRNAETGNVEPWAQQIVDSLDSYAELSVTGTGVHIIARGTLPGPRRRQGKVEMYSDGRYFTMSGNVLAGSVGTINECQTAIDDLYRVTFDDNRHQENAVSVPQTSATLIAGNVTDQQIIRVASQARNGAKFKALWAGEFNGYESQSEADLALCNYLAFYAGPDAARIDSLFRQSGLMREKWGEREDYRNTTIQRSIEGCSVFFDWSRTSRDRDGGDRTSNGLIVTSEIALLQTRIANAEIIETDRSKDFVPLSMPGIIGNVMSATGGWPRRVGSALFVHEGKNRVDWIDKTAGLVGYLGSKTGVPPAFYRHPCCHSAAQLHAELQRTAEAYDAVETLPHEPPIESHYYTCSMPTPGNGETLRALVDRFSPATPIDGDLILAMFATAFWGGPCGSRPAFTITSDAGRGAGKTTLAAMLSHLVGGHIELSANEDATVVKQRLLSPEGLCKRVALLDNVKTLRFSWAEFEAMITSPTVSGKRMYVGEASRPNNLVWVITLNGVSLATDMAQRSIIIRIERPKHSGTWAEDTRKFIDDNRGRIIADIIGFLRGGIHPLNSFTRWGAWEQAVVQRLPDPSEAQAVFMERQKEANVETEETDIIQQYFHAKLVSLSYQPDTDRVFIPSTTIAGWFNEAMREKNTTTGASRKLNQKIREGSIRRLEVNKGRALGRGFVWISENIVPDAKIHVDIQLRIREQIRKESRENEQYG